MSNQLARRGASGIDRVPRHVSRAIEVQHYRGLEASARVRAAAYVAHVGLTLTAQLSAQEGVLIQHVPLAEPRLKCIVDQFAIMASAEVAGMGL